MTQEEKTKIEEKIVDVLKTVYDPEIPVNIWDLGMIYKIDVKDDATVDLDMTFTAPSCPAADFILEDVRTKVDSVEGSQVCQCKPRIRTSLGSEYDERGSSCRTRLRIKRKPLNYSLFIHHSSLKKNRL